MSRRTSFNTIRLSTTAELDEIVRAQDLFRRQSFARACPAQLESSVGARCYPMASPEDLVLQKLAWYRSGSKVWE